MREEDAKAGILSDEDLRFMWEKGAIAYILPGRGWIVIWGRLLNGKYR